MVQNKIKETWMLIVLFSLTFIGVANALTDLNVNNIFFVGSLVQQGVEGHLLPSGTILMFNGSCPTGWTEQTHYQGTLLRVDSVANVGKTGGSDTHTHSISGTSAAETAHTHTSDPPQVTSAAESSHTHSFSDTVSSSTDNEAAHTHGVGTLDVSSHTHGIGTLDGPAHTHSVNPGGATSSSRSCSQARGTTDTRTLYATSHTHYVDYGGVTSAGRISVSRWGTSGTAVGDSVVGGSTSGAGSAHNHGLTDYTAAGTSGAGSSHDHDYDLTNTETNASEHSHDVGTLATSEETLLPPYINVVFCAKD